MRVDVAVDGAVGTLTLDSPPLKLLSDDLRRALLDALSDFRARRLRAVIVTGRGRAFCAGADLRDEAKLTTEQVQAFLDADEAVFTALAEFPGATIAAVNGYAYGRLRAGAGLRHPRGRARRALRRRRCEARAHRVDGPAAAARR